MDSKLLNEVQLKFGTSFLIAMSDVSSRVLTGYLTFNSNATASKFFLSIT